jgi:intein/homing endonuclease
MGDGSTKAIQDVHVGDIVMSQDEDGSMKKNIVTRIFRHGPDEHGATPYELLKINGDLEVTAEHPIHTKKGWVEAGELSVGDVLTGLSGDIVVTSIEQGEIESYVYNLTTFPTHTYFAGGVLVHNKLQP